MQGVVEQLGWAKQGQWVWDQHDVDPGLAQDWDWSETGTNGRDVNGNG